MPIIGQYQISDIARVSYILNERWGRIVRLGGLLGRPDLLFVYDADEIEKVCGYIWHFCQIFRSLITAINVKEILLPTGSLQNIRDGKITSVIFNWFSQKYERENTCNKMLKRNSSVF